MAGNGGLVLVLPALSGAIMWNLITWYLTIPSSSSHALIGGVIGATLVASGSGAVNVHKLLQSVIVPTVLSPFICGAVALLGTLGAYRLIGCSAPARRQGLSTWTDRLDLAGRCPCGLKPDRIPSRS